MNDSNGRVAAKTLASGTDVGGTFMRESNRPKETGISYSSAGGGEAYFNPTPANLWSYVCGFISEESSRKDYSNAMIVGPDFHTRPPQWMEDKNVSIDGTPLTDEQRNAPNFWQAKYRKELDIGEAIQEVKKQRRMEATHDVIGSIAMFKRRLGLNEPLNEEYARLKVEERHRRLEAFRDENDGDSLNDTGVERRRQLGLGTPWRVLMESVETGQPIAKVANEYRPSVDFYGIDPFLDSSISLIWFCTKCGIAIGIAQGTAKAIQAINVDVQFLKASGVGILSILNMSVFANVVKWGGNCALFASAFSVGDRLATLVKYKLLPPHDARRRSTSNYVVGLAMSGGTVGILPWWILSDAMLAARLSVSGIFLGGVLGFAVGNALNRLVALNISRLDATNREIRRYEALMRRQRSWVNQEREKLRRQAYVWW